MWGQPPTRLRLRDSHWTRAADAAPGLPPGPQVSPGTGGRPSSDSYPEGASTAAQPGLSCSPCPRSRRPRSAAAAVVGAWPPLRSKLGAFRPAEAPEGEAEVVRLTCPGLLCTSPVGWPRRRSGLAEPCGLSGAGPASWLEKPRRGAPHSAECGVPRAAAAAAAIRRRGGQPRGGRSSGPLRAAAPRRSGGDPGRSPRAATGPRRPRAPRRPALPDWFHWLKDDSPRAAAELELPVVAGPDTAAGLRL